MIEKMGNCMQPLGDAHATNAKPRRLDVDWPGMTPPFTGSPSPAYSTPLDASKANPKV
jgi:hypothetical protein